jgi:type I restriction enzyme R subunit
MNKPTEHKTVQARILEYADAIGWTIVPREEAERRSGFEPQMTQRSADPEPQKGHRRKSATSAVKYSSKRR